jgi:hypothetical protein
MLCLTVANTLAYHIMVLFAVVKIFKAEAAQVDENLPNGNILIMVSLLRISSLFYLSVFFRAPQHSAK